MAKSEIIDFRSTPLVQDTRVVQSQRLVTASIGEAADEITNLRYKEIF